MSTIIVFDQCFCRFKDFSLVWQHAKIVQICAYEDIGMHDINYNNETNWLW